MVDIALHRKLKIEQYEPTEQWESTQKLRNGKQFLLRQNYNLTNRGMCVNAYVSITLGDALFTASPGITSYVFRVVRASVLNCVL